MSKDYKVVSEPIWKFLSERYGGTEIRRFYKKSYSYGAEIEATLKEIPVCIFPALEDLMKFENVETKSIFMSKHDTVNDLKERLAKVLKKQGMKIEVDQI